MRKASLKIIHKLLICGLLLSHPQIFAQSLSKQFQNFVQKNQIKSVDNISTVLKQFGINELTWSYKSGALLPASPTQLRPIFWSLKDAFIITYSSHQNSNQSDVIEALEWDELAQKTRLLEMNLAEPMPKWTEPKKCLECHGVGARPLWQEYPRWDGFIGSNDDFINIGDEEQKILSEYIADNQDNPRVSFTFNESVFSNKYRPSDKVAGPELSFFYVRPNMRLGKLLQKINAKRIKAQLKHIDLETKAMALSLFMNCRSLIDDEVLEVLDQLNLTLHDFFIDTLAENEVTANFNESYSDGSAIINELLIPDLIRSIFPKYKDRKFMLLKKKHSLRHEGNQIDKYTFSTLDAYGDWFPLPFEDSQLNFIRKRPQPPESYLKIRQSLCAQL